MNEKISRTVSLVSALILTLASASRAHELDDWETIEKINMHGFTWTEQVIRSHGGPMVTGTLGQIVLLSNCPRKGCVTLSGSFNFKSSGDAQLVLEGSDCRPILATVDVNGMISNDLIVTVPADPACADVPREVSGRYFAICFWYAPYGDLSWTGWHKRFTCNSQENRNGFVHEKGFLVGPRAPSGR